MITARVKHSFVSNGKRVNAGTVIRFPRESLRELATLVEVIDDDLTEAEQLMQKNAADFSRFCLAHEATMQDGHCKVKHNRFDPMTDCLGWQMKTRRLH